MAENKTNLIINYLPQKLSDEEFLTLFRGIGPVRTAKIVRDNNSDYSYGFGFVRYYDTEMAQLAIETLNGFQMGHKTIKVAFSREGDNVKNANLYIKNVPKHWDKNTLHGAFCMYGTIVNTTILTDKGSGGSKGVGFVLFENKDQAQAALSAMDGVTPPSATEALVVSFGEDNAKKVRKPADDFEGYGMGRGGGPMRGRGMGMRRGAPPRPLMGGRGRESPYGAGLSTAIDMPAPPRFYNPRAELEDLLYDGRGHEEFGDYDLGYEDDYSRGLDPGFGPMRSAPAASRFRYNPMSEGRGMSSMGRGSRGMPQMRGGRGRGGGGGGPPSQGGQGHIVFAYNIGEKTDESGLYEMFSPYGEITQVNVIMDHAKGKGKGFGFVTMTDYSEAEHAIFNLNGYDFQGNGHPLQVKFKSDKQ